ncbi:MAG: amino acid adenylation domain-containing protein [Candidatus Binatia bacterium]
MQINVLEYFLKTAERWPSKVAVADGQEEWSFEKLWRRAVAIARQISKRSGGANQPIAVYLPKTNEAIASFLGVLFSGNCYAPLDVKAPIARVHAILGHLEPSLVLTTRALAAQLQNAGTDPADVIILDEVADDEGPIPAQWKQCVDTDPVYIIHTSGSTGNPKGVVVTHRGVIDYIDWARDTFKIDEQCVIGNQAPLIFDNSTLDIYLCFSCGATLHLTPEELFLFPVRLLEYLAEKAINFIFWVPSIMVAVADKKVLDRVEKLRLEKILFAGEVMPAKHLNIWRARFPSALFANLYGPTEITVDCTFYVVDRDFADDEPVPIGGACRNADILILDEQNKACQAAERGELCVRGSSLAAGYWNQPTQTAAAFVQNPLNSHYPDLIYRTGDLVYRNERNEIIYVGRKDFQIKHMGYRIELGDIEHFALQVPGVRNSCVLYHLSKKEIVLVYEADSDIDPAIIRNELGRNLPKYMWPTIFRSRPELPRTSNGKIDRQRLMTEYGS